MKHFGTQGLTGIIYDFHILYSSETELWFSWNSNAWASHWNLKNVLRFPDLILSKWKDCHWPASGYSLAFPPPPIYCQGILLICLVFCKSSKQTNSHLTPVLILIMYTLTNFKTMTSSLYSLVQPHELVKVHATCWSTSSERMEYIELHNHTMYHRIFHWATSRFYMYI